jgi:surface antigen
MSKISSKSFLPVVMTTTLSIATLTGCGKDLVPVNNTETKIQEESREIESNESNSSQILNIPKEVYGIKSVLYVVIPGYIKDAFAKKEKAVGSGIGKALSNIQKLPNGKGYIKYYAGANGAGSGVLIYNLSKANVYWVHGGLYVKYIKDGGMNKYGLPKSDEMLNPTRQKFEGGTVLWNNGKPYIEGTNNETKFPAPNFNSPFYGSKNHMIARNGSGYKGECTWYVDGRLQELGLYPSSISNTGFIGHAKAWKSFAESKGLIVSKTPKVGSVMVSISGLYEHVAFTERVNADGSFIITESNLHGNNKYNGERKVSSVNSTTYFIYLK